MTVHFIYSVPVSGYGQALFRKMAIGLQMLGADISPMGRREEVPVNTWPETSPISITKHLYTSLKKKAKVRLYSINEQTKVRLKKDDILIGHPSFPFKKWRPGVLERTLSDPGRIATGKKALITPLHCNTDVMTGHLGREYLENIDRIMSGVDTVFGIMGEYWWDKWDNSEFAHWKKKMVRLDMAVDTNYFPAVKKRFNPPGKRKFFYIGRNSPEKGAHILSETFTHMGGKMCGWIGSGEDIPGLFRISRQRALDPVFMREVAEDFDFFITAGIADANPTTILESMAWGFPVLCTPQSGYYEKSYMKNIHPENIYFNMHVIEDLQRMDEDELVRMALEARRVVEEKHNWGVFTSRVMRALFDADGEKTIGHIGACNNAV